MLKVITNVAIKSEPDYETLYYNAFHRAISSLVNDNQNDKQQIMQAVFCGVKYVKHNMDKPKTKENIHEKQIYINLIRKLMEQLTPAEFVNTFPAKKEYDGEKSGWKDYFFSMQAINKLNPNEPIGENIDHLLFDYQNNDLAFFLMTTLTNADDLMHLNGQRGIMEQWLEANDIPTFTEYTAASGKKYIQDNTTGRTAKVRRKMPRYIKVV